jgi:hypothetical protein
VDEAIARNARMMARLIESGTVIPFLGAGANLVSRAPNERFMRGVTLPSGAELAADLASYFEYPDAAGDLMHVSQYVAVEASPAELYNRLHSLFDADYPPTSLHQLLASVPSLQRSRGSPAGLVVVTTNYDDALERAFTAAGEPFDLVYYLADGPQRGRFAHVQADGPPLVIDRPNEYAGLRPDERSIIAKIHGAIDRVDPDNDSFVITEDDYIDYLTRTDISDLIPVQLAARLKRSHFLFLGYSLRDWNLRVILRRIRAQQRHSFNSWGIQLDPAALDVKWWQRQGVDLIPCRLDAYTAELARALDRTPVEEAS